MKRIAKLSLVIAMVMITLALAACTPVTKTEPPVLSADKTTAAPGEVVTLTATPAAAEGVAVTYEITEGTGSATVSADGKLTVAANAANGTKITVVCKYGDEASNAVTVTVVVPATAIEISSNKSEIEAGKIANLTANITPAGAEQAGFAWEITSGADIATINGNSIAIDDDATVGSTVTVVGKLGDLVSNTLTFTVKASALDNLLILNMSNDNLTVDSKGASSPVLLATVLNYSFEELDNDVTFEIVSGSEFIDITANGNACSFIAKAHGTAIVKATIEGTSISENVTVNAIVPPSALKTPDVFAERPGYNYNFSKVDALPFVPTIVGTNVCTDYTVSFKDASGNTEDVGTYEDGKITFLKTGLVTVTVTSDSGSRVEASASYTFNVNEGTNVYTYEELKALLADNDYDGQIINIVALTKPSAEYGYELVPQYALAPKSEQSLAQLAEGVAHLIAYNKDVYINGNNHSINLSNVRTFTAAERNQVGYDTAPHALYIESDIVGKIVDVKLYDFSLIGNCPVDYVGEMNGKTPYGVSRRGIHIGSSNPDNTATYRLEMKGVSVSKFYAGIRLNHVIDNGLVENVHVYNCFSNGLEVAASSLILKDMKYGICGAAGIEITPDSCNNAGVNFNQPQSITFTGTIENTNLSDGNSIYMNAFQVGGVTVPQIIQGNFQAYAQNQAVYSNLVKDGKFSFIAFKFSDFNTLTPNSSVVTYYNMHGSGIIDASQLTGVDTTHQYITMEIYVPLQGQNVSVGTVLLYNHNYAGE